METDMSGGAAAVVTGRGGATPCLDPLWKPADTFEETWSARKTGMKSDLYLREPAAGAQICDIQRHRDKRGRQSECGVVGGGGRGVVDAPPPPSTSPITTTAFILLSSELFSECLPGKFNGCGIWTGKKRRWKFQRKQGFVPHEGSTSVCVLPGRGRGRVHESRSGRKSVSERFQPTVQASWGVRGVGGGSQTHAWSRIEQYRHSLPDTHTHTKTLNTQRH